MTTEASIDSLTIHFPRSRRNVRAKVSSSTRTLARCSRNVSNSQRRSVADHVGKAGLDCASTHDAGSKGGDLLKGQPGRAVLVWRQIQQREYVGRQPPGTHLVARKARALGDHDVPA